MRQGVAVGTVIVALFAASGPWGGSPIDARAVAEQCFPQTGKCVSGLFYDYWQANGGLAQQGYPISDEFDEVSPTNGKTYKTQYFERARFEHHPENAAPYNVLLGLLGREQFLAKYPNGRPPTTSAGDKERCFPETGRCVSGLFYDYWQANGGLAQQGFPISDEFDEVNPTNGKTYKTQYFERARFEHHPENAAPYNVLLGLLGREQFLPKNQPDTSYTPDLDPNLLNPERGIYYWSTFNGDEDITLVPHTLKAEWLYLGTDENTGSEFCNQELTWNGHHQPGTTGWLNEYADKLVDHRNAGTKVVFRPRYDNPGDASSQSNICHKLQAEGLDLQLRHVEAVAKMLGEFKDVVAFIEAGYLGSWGEWNTQTGPAPLLDSVSDREAVLRHILQKYDEVGLLQHIGMRRPVFAAEAIALKPDARVGIYNDCFMTNKHDRGTYLNFKDSNQNFPGDEDAQIAHWKQWAVSHTADASFGGETCPSDGNERWRSCSNMVGANSEPAALHMSYLHGGYSPAAIKIWEDGDDDGVTCYDEIRRRLGYRFEVTRVEYTPTVAAGQTFQVRVDVANTGWAKLHKPRQAKLVLRNGSTTHVYDIPAGAVASWAPGQTTTLSVNAPAPSAGTYSVRLWIPDPDVPPGATKETKSKYAVKLATLRNGANVFDPTTGENNLGLSIVVPDTANLGTLNVTVRKCISETSCTGHKAYLYLTYPTGEILPAETDAAGKYSFTNLKPGSYEVESTIQANGKAYSLRDLNVSVIAGQTKTRTYDIKVPPPAAIERVQPIHAEPTPSFTVGAAADPGRWSSSEAANQRANAVTPTDGGVAVPSGALFGNTSEPQRRGRRAATARWRLG